MNGFLEFYYPWILLSLTSLTYMRQSSISLDIFVKSLSSFFGLSAPNPFTLFQFLSIWDSCTILLKKKIICLGFIFYIRRHLIIRRVCACYHFEIDCGHVIKGWWCRTFSSINNISIDSVELYFSFCNMRQYVISVSSFKICLKNKFRVTRNVGMKTCLTFSCWIKKDHTLYALSCNWREVIVKRREKRSRGVKFSNCLDICTCEVVVSNLLCLTAAIYRSHVV